MRALIAATAAVLLVTGCGGGTELDRDAWADDITELSAVPAARDGEYQDAWIDTVCTMSTDGFRRLIVLELSDGKNPDLLASSTQHACPDRLELVEDLLSE